MTASHFLLNNLGSILAPAPTHKLNLASPSLNHLHDLKDQYILVSHESVLRPDSATSDTSFEHVVNPHREYDYEYEARFKRANRHGSRLEAHQRRALSMKVRIDVEKLERRKIGTRKGKLGLKVPSLVKKVQNRKVRVQAPSTDKPSSRYTILTQPPFHYPDQSR